MAVARARNEIHNFSTGSCSTGSQKIILRLNRYSLQRRATRLWSMCRKPCFRQFLSSRSKGKFCAIQVDLKNAPFPDLKLNNFPVPLEARIEPWLEREANSPFSVRRLEMEQHYPSGPLEVLRPLFLLMVCRERLNLKELGLAQGTESAHS